jgi:parallel beta-helix repeat protein
VLKKLIYSLPILLLGACGGEPANETEIVWQDIEKDLQTKFIMAEDGETITLPEGNYAFRGTISLEGKRDITIRGAGMDKTVLSFKGQTEGAEGLRIDNCHNIVLEDFTLQDSKGDLMKGQKVNRFTMRNVKAEWTGEPQESNGAYAFYPVDCDTVLMENCIAIGASDAGIYVGQSRDIIVRKCEAYHNVAGIEIENCIRADVYENNAHGNTGGILIFDMPGLTQSGSHVRVFDNVTKENNFRNFAPAGNIVGEVPPGTGVLVLATKQVEIYNNIIEGNKTIAVAVISYNLVRKPHEDKAFDPYPKAVTVYDNTISRDALTLPAMEYDLSKLLLLKFPINRPDIIFDGHLDPTLEAKNSNYVGENRICVGDNKGARFANVDAPNGFKKASTDRTNFDCSLAPLAPVKL